MWCQKDQARADTIGRECGWPGGMGPEQDHDRSRCLLMSRAGLFGRGYQTGKVITSFSAVGVNNRAGGHQSARET